MNKLYYGDNLEVLKESIEDESIDLIYIDPPFNSKRAYNILFESIDLSDAKAQKEAFADTWSNVSYIDELNEIQDLNLDLFRFLKTLDSLNISKGAVSYLTIMAHRIWYMHKKLKQTGSFYLHCDPTMSHYLKIVMDLIFGVKNFRNELVWHYRRWTAGSKQFQRMHDIILFYSKSNNYYFKIPYEPYGNWIKKDYKYIDEKTGKRWRWHTVKGVKYKVILEDEDKGVKCNDVFQFPYIGSTSKERLGYPTQKPEQLLERIIEASSKKGDTVADFFCGCGTTIAIAQKLNRKWIGVDISHLAVRLIYNRLLKPFEESDEKYKEIINNIDINGFPKDIASAKDLAQKTKKGRLKFQDWVIEIMLRGVSNPKKTADGGYDGYVTFYKSPEKKDIVLIEVKSGNVNVNKIRELIEVVNREKASIGVLVCFEEQVTKPMIVEAKGAGYYEPQVFMNRYDKIQIITIEELLEGKSINYPLYQNITFKNASKVDIKENNNSNSLFD